MRPSASVTTKCGVASTIRTIPLKQAARRLPWPISSRSWLNSCAPRTVRTLGRVVSVDDYADYARTFAGVGKARGDVLWDGVRRIVHLTVAGASGTGNPGRSTSDRISFPQTCHPG